MNRERITSWTTDGRTAVLSSCATVFRQGISFDQLMLPTDVFVFASCFPE